MTKPCTHDWEHLWYLWDGEKEGYGRKCRNCDEREEENPEMILLMHEPVQVISRKKV